MKLTIETVQSIARLYARQRYKGLLFKLAKCNEGSTIAMKCFSHQASDAVAGCKHCGKGICAACAIDTGHGVACSEACSGHVLQLASLMKSTTAASNINKGMAAFLWPAFLCVLGIAFVAEELLSDRPSAGGLAIVMGSLFIFFGIALGAVQHSWRKRSGQDRHT